MKTICSILLRYTKPYPYGLSFYSTFRARIRQTLYESSAYRPNILPPSSTPTLPQTIEKEICRVLNVDPKLSYSLKTLEAISVTSMSKISLNQLVYLNDLWFVLSEISDRKVPKFFLSMQSYLPEVTDNLQRNEIIQLLWYFGMYRKKNEQVEKQLLDNLMKHVRYLNRFELEIVANSFLMLKIHNIGNELIERMKSMVLDENDISWSSIITFLKFFRAIKMRDMQFYEKFCENILKDRLQQLSSVDICHIIRTLCDNRYHNKNIMSSLLRKLSNHVVAQHEKFSHVLKLDELYNTHSSERLRCKDISRVMKCISAQGMTFEHHCLENSLEILLDEARRRVSSGEYARYAADELSDLVFALAIMGKYDKVVVEKIFEKNVLGEILRSSYIDGRRQVYQAVESFYLMGCVDEKLRSGIKEKFALFLPMDFFHSRFELKERGKYGFVKLFRLLQQEYGTLSVKISRAVPHLELSDIEVLMPDGTLVVIDVIDDTLVASNDKNVCSGIFECKKRLLRKPKKIGRRLSLPNKFVHIVITHQITCDIFKTPFPSDRKIFRNEILSRINARSTQS